MNRRALLWSLVGAVALSSRAPARSLPLHPERASPFDLAITGRVDGLAPGETRFVRWSDLHALPTRRLRLTGEFVPGEQEVTIVFLDDIRQRLACSSGADAFIATCRDGYVSVYPMEALPRLRPFVVLEINGDGPDKWPPSGLTFNPGPYVISVSAAVAPDVATLLDAGHKRPWAVTALEVARMEDRFGEFSRGRWAELSPAAVRGREIWINSCASCHTGPGGAFGGQKAERPFEVIAAHAAYNAAYFRRYVRNPKGEISGAKMEAHPHYSDEQLDALIAFITADGKP